MIKELFPSFRIFLHYFLQSEGTTAICNVAIKQFEIQSGNSFTQIY